MIEKRLCSGCEQERITCPRHQCCELCDHCGCFAMVQWIRLPPRVLKIEGRNADGHL